MDGPRCVPASGLRVLVEPDEPTLDIVFVHGFTGHPERTWTHKAGDARYSNSQHSQSGDINDSNEPPSKVRRLNPLLASRPKGSNSVAPVYWPRDLLPLKVPQARVLTFGYDTHLRHWLGPPVNKNTVYDIAWNFLVSLEAERRPDPTRATLFIVHSLGGIVIKEMLRRSCGYRLGQSHLRSIFESTIGIIFFGTPHAGADPLGFPQQVAVKAIKAAGFSVNEQIVNTLLPSAERLRELRDEFGPMALQQNWIIHSFQEQIGVKLLNNQKVVEDTSSYLNIPAIETTEHISRNHMEMCRFTGLDDIEFKKFSAALHHIVTSAKEKPGKGVRTLSVEQRRTFLDSLRFSQIDARQMTIKNAHAKTCKWLLKRSEYLGWLDPDRLNEHHGLLWIKGKPGTGKSTLMKFVLMNARRTMKEKMVISFFFNARGDDLERSTIGLYRSILLQLLERVPTLENTFESLEMVAGGTSIPQWTTESLKALFAQAVQSVGNTSVLCLIDALDECDEHQIRDMVSFFGHIGELALSTGLRFQVCFSSRHYPHITVRRGTDLILEGQEGHDQDITNYIDSELKIGYSNLAQGIRSELQEKAAGVFMWVVLVVEILNKEYDGGRVHVLRRRLRDIPGDLHELFRDILTRDDHEKESLLLCIQWVLFARKPLTPNQLYSAILSGAEPEALSSLAPEEVTLSIVQRFILDCSKGLVEVTKSADRTVQFIHESVKDFLLKEKGLAEIWPALANKVEGQSHEVMKQCCLTYIDIAKSSPHDFGEPLPKASSKEAAALRHSIGNTFPLLQYAVQHVLHHADAAEGFDSTQKDFITKFAVTEWIKLDNIFERFEIRRHTPKASLLYILAEQNLANLIGIHPAIISSIEVEDERYGPPLFAALATKSHRALQVFLKALGISYSRTQSLYTGEGCFPEQKTIDSVGRDFKFPIVKSLLWYLYNIGSYNDLATLIATGKSKLDIKNEAGQTLLCEALQNDHPAMLQLLIENGANIQLDDEDNGGRTPLVYAIENGHENIERLLLERGASTEWDHLHTPLCLAVSFGREMVVKLLLERGLDINGENEIGETPLSLAARSKSLKMVMLLFKHGADINLKNQRGETALFSAARSERSETVKLLLDKGADINLQNKDNETALFSAARWGKSETMKLLLDKGADINLQNKDNETALFTAAGWGSLEIVKLLLNKGADINLKDNRGKTALFEAVRYGGLEAVRLLLDKDAEIECINELGETLLCSAAGSTSSKILELLLDRSANIEGKIVHLEQLLKAAIRQNRADNVQLLLSRGANINGEGYRASVLLWLAVRGGNEDLTRLLLEKGADVDARETFHDTPLLWTLRYQMEKLVPVLLNGGADRNAQDKRGITPLSLAASRGKGEYVRTLLEEGANTDIQDIYGLTPLAWAVKNEHESVVHLLLKHGANVNIRDSGNWTPLRQAVEKQNETIIQMLLEHGAVPEDTETPLPM